MYSRHVSSVRRSGSERRGSVLILVVGVLAMLFVIGATQLMVARFEKQNAERKLSGSNLRGVASMVYLPLSELFQSDALAATNADLDPGQQDSADFTGSAVESVVNGYLDTLANLSAGQRQTLKEYILLGRSGDALVSSLEPHWDPVLQAWRYFSISLGVDALTQSASLPVNNTFEPQLAGSPPLLTANSDIGDADGDGWTDSKRLDVALSSVYGGKYSLFQRAISHGGMVMLDRTTHPALLAQIIHPKDTKAHNNPATVFFSNWSRTTTDEARLRRRYLLPESTDPDNSATWSKLASNDLRKLLPFTLGYLPTGSYSDTMAPHWWPVGSDPTISNDNQWWASHLRPQAALTEATYSQNSDTYDRRHLLTVYSYDDLLRPQRNEQRLLRFQTSPGTYIQNSMYGQYFHVINPTAASETVYTWDSQARWHANCPPLAYGMMPSGTGYSLEFNRPGLRMPFSLRDTLVPPIKNMASDAGGNSLSWGYQASFRRAVQLTGYYLAMIQNTTVPGTAHAGQPNAANLRTQLDTALQLAVNTIDFADNADVTGDGLVNNSDIKLDTNGDGDVTAADITVDPLTALTYTWNNAGNNETVAVYGFEKQPFLTEAYVKLIHKPVPPANIGEPWTWEANPDPIESIYAVELYNPYLHDMQLDDFALQLSPTVFADLAKIVIPAQSSIVLANNTVDAARYALGLPASDFVDPFIKGATKTGAGQNLFLAGTDFKVLSWTEASGLTTETGISDFKITPSIAVSLVRKTVLHLELNNNTGLPSARLQTADTANRIGAHVVVDTLLPSGLGENTNNLALDSRFGADVASTDVKAATNPARAVTDWNGRREANDRLVSESSLQRRKAHQNWHYTIGRQMVFPLPWYEHKDNINPSTAAPWVCDRPDTLPQHNLLGTAPFTGMDGATTNQSIVARYMDGVQVSFPVASAPTLPYADGRAVTTVKNGTQFFVPVTEYSQTPVAPVQLVTSDLGLDANGRCRAYPTTGTLLLVARHAHIQQSTGLKDLPMSMTLAQSPQITSQYSLDYTTGLGRGSGNQLLQVDNGHLPIFDPDQVVLGEARRLQTPWGQLAYEYFTALPIEELFEYRNLSGYVAGATNARLVDLFQSYPTAFENAYKFIVNGLLPDFFGSCPVQEVVASDGVNTVGPRVRGRININYAPWWVLDGLPVLPDVYYDPTNVAYGLYNGVPVPEMLSNQLDPSGYIAANGTSRPAELVINSTFMDDVSKAAASNAGFATLSPALARYLVSYREKRIVEGQTDPLIYLSNETSFSKSPGFVGVGAMCDVLQRVPMGNLKYANGTLAAGIPMFALRTQLDPQNQATTSLKPFSYVGYLQMVAPLARIQDWVTAKSHVYTVYNVVGDNSEPPVYLRSQTTIDRTRCLYTNDLPERIVQTEPISYFNAVSDQQ